MQITLIEERCRYEGIVPTDVHYELLLKLRCLNVGGKV